MSGPGLHETGPELDRKSVVSLLFSPLSWGKGDRDTNVVHSSRDRENLQKILERKVDLAVRGEREAQQKLYQAEAEVEARNWKREIISDFAFQEINRQFESQQFQLHPASRWADQAQRDKISLYGDLELRKRLFQENHARDCQEIEDLRRICREETDRAIPAKNEDLLVQQQRNPTILSQMMAEIRDSQNKVNSLSDAREFHDPESESSSGATHVPDQTSTITTLRLDCRKIHRIVRVLWETFLNYHLFKEYTLQSSTIQTILASSSQDLRPHISGTARREMKSESLNTPTQSPHFQSGSGMLNPTGGTYSHSGMMDYPRVLFTEWNLGNFPDSVEFQSWSLILELKFVCGQLILRSLLWIKEVVIGQSDDELVTSRSIARQHNFLDFGMLDAMIASALQKLINTQSSFRKRESGTQNLERFFRGRQIAYMTYEHTSTRNLCSVFFFWRGRG